MTWARRGRAACQSSRRTSYPKGGGRTHTTHKYLNAAGRGGGCGGKPSISAGDAEDHQQVSALILLVFFCFLFHGSPFHQHCGENPWHYAVDCCENHSFGFLSRPLLSSRVRLPPPFLPTRNLDANIGRAGPVLKGHFKSI